MREWLLIVVVMLVGIAPFSSARSAVDESRTQVKMLNAFAGELMAIISVWRTSDEVRTKEQLGGYSGMPEYYREVDYTDAATGRLLGRVRWINEHPDTPQMIELFIYDKAGRLVADYFVSYLTTHRNAPMHALINLHFRDSELQAFRQFDIFGERLFERCQGEYFGEQVDVSIDPFETEMSAADVPPELYASCFGYIPVDPGAFRHPAKLLPMPDGSPQHQEPDEFIRIEAGIAELDRRIAAAPDNADLYVRRGDLKFSLRRMDDAVDDFSRALNLDPNLDAAYFGRGMALGRMGRFAEGIADLSQFIQRNPNSSLGYTKRGVRKIWNKDFIGAVTDLKMAVALDDRNAEAHDDLGVALAQTGELDLAIEHFFKARSIDPSYQKVHHNLATVLYMVGDHAKALNAVDEALSLAPGNKNSLLLKGTILESLGRTGEAETVRAQAEFLPEGNWSERSAIE